MNEARILDVITEIGKFQRGVPEQDGRLLCVLTKAIQAREVVEIGTGFGCSALWIALGLLGSGGRLTTFDPDEARQAQAQAHFKKAGVSDRITVIAGDVLKKMYMAPPEIDLLFIDTEKSAYINCLEAFGPRVLIVSHDMRRPGPDMNFVRRISAGPHYTTAFANMDNAGIAISVKTS